MSSQKIGIGAPRLAIIAVAGLAAGAGLLNGSPASAAGPSPELAPLEWFVGSWDCHGTIFENSGATAIEATAQASFAADGQSLVWALNEEPGAESSVPFAGQWTWRWDSVISEFRVEGTNNRGGTSNETSPGWTGDRLTTQGQQTPPNSPTLGSRTSYIKTSDITVSVVNEANVGTWVTAYDVSCQRS